MKSKIHRSREVIKSEQKSMKQKNRENKSKLKALDKNTQEGLALIVGNYTMNTGKS